MGNFTCICGQHMPLKTGVESYERFIVPKRLINLEIAEMSELGGGKIDVEAFYRHFDRDALPALICPNCERIWMYRPGEDRMSSFIREEKKEHEHPGDRVKSNGST